jgi:hypothetical protein
LSELWPPFITRKFKFQQQLTVGDQNPSSYLIGNYNASRFFESMRSYIKRLAWAAEFSDFQDFHRSQRLRISQRLNYKDHVYISESSKHNKRGGQYIKVLANHISW